MPLKKEFNNTSIIFKMDVKPGGEWEFIMHGPDGIDYKNKHVYREVVKPEKIVLDHVQAGRLPGKIINQNNFIYHG